MSSRTLFLSRLIGLYCLIYGLATIVHGQFIADALAKLTSDPLAVLCLSVFTVIAGLAMVLAHNVWSKVPAVVIVTLVGWLTLVKGMAFLFLPASWLGRPLNSGTYFYSVTGLLLVLGAYLAHEGFLSKPSR
jgi:hypothetical protein